MEAPAVHAASIIARKLVSSGKASLQMISNSCQVDTLVEEFIKKILQDQFSGCELHVLIAINFHDTIREQRFLNVD